MKKYKYLFFLILFCIFGCLSVKRYSREEIEKEKIELKQKLVANSLLNIYILDFKNASKNEEINYLSNAISELLLQYLYIMEQEEAYIPYKVSYMDLTPYIKKDTYFYKYVTNINSMLTQFSTNIMEDIREEDIFVTNKLVKNRKTILEVKTNKNIITNIITNVVVSNVISTNLPMLTEENFYKMIKEEFKELEKEISHFKISLSRNFQEKKTDFYSIVTGEYRISKESKLSGPKTIEIEIVCSNFLSLTNVVSYKLVSREDIINEKIMDFIKEYRKLILNKPVCDIIVTSYPEDVDIYLDGIFMGKTPLYYPSIKSGRHRITFSKQGYKRVSLEYNLIPDITNNIYKDLDINKTGGIVKIDSKIENSRVFINSQYEGKTPLVVSNLQLFEKYRVVVYPPQTNLAPFYYNFTLKDVNDNIEINANFSTQLGNTELFKKTMWGVSFLSWGLVVTFIGLDVYSHYLAEYYKDEYYSYGGNKDKYNFLYYDSMSKVYYNYFLFSTVLSLGTTALALHSEDIYLGIYTLDRNNIVAQINFKF